jgi:hypothetical protein
MALIDAACRGAKALCKFSDGGGPQLWVIFIWLALTPSVAALAEPMTFFAEPPAPLLQKFMSDHRWTIYAEGEIDSEADKRLENLIVAKNIPKSSIIYLHSLGGNLAAGMRLGKIFREHQLSAYIGQRVSETSRDKRIIPGVCASSCAMAFLGAKFRFWTDKSVYGVHRFFLNSKKDSLDGDIAQIISSAVVNYLQSMEISTGLFTLASQVGATEIVTLPRQKLEELNVINNGITSTKWTIESSGVGVYVKGERNTAIGGVQKFMIMCPPTGPMLLMIGHDAGVNAQQAMTFRAVSLAIDWKNISISKREASRQNINGNIVLGFSLDSSLVLKIRNAKRVGVVMQPTYKTAFFLGYDDMPVAEDAVEKLDGIVSICQR